MLINQKFLSFHASNLPLLKSKCLPTSGPARGRSLKNLKFKNFYRFTPQPLAKKNIFFFSVNNYSTGSTTFINKSSHLSLSLNNPDYSVKLKNAAPTTTYMPATASNTEMSQLSYTLQS